MKKVSKVLIHVLCIAILLVASLTCVGTLTSSTLVYATTPAPSITPSVTPTATVSPSYTPSYTPSASPSYTPSTSPSPSITPATPTPTPTSLYTNTPTPTPTPTPTKDPNATDTPTPTPTPTPIPGTYNTYYGHLHNHTIYSDGQGTPAQAYTYARDVSKLDFLGIADHSNNIDPTEWANTISAANTYNQDGTFITFAGFEWSSFGNYGHVAVVNSSDYCTYTDPSTDTFAEFLTWLSSRDCVAFFNHPGRENQANREFSHFAATPSEKFVGIELWNKNDAFNMYYYNNDGYYTGDGNKSYYDEAIARNWKIGAAGSEDNHVATWGNMNNYRVGVLAPEKTRAAIYAALQARRFFTTLDKNLTLSFELNGAQMGSVVLGPGTFNAVIKAGDADGEVYSQIDLIKNGTVLQTWNPNIASPTVTRSVTTLCGDHERQA